MSFLKSILFSGFRKYSLFHEFHTKKIIYLLQKFYLQWKRKISFKVSDISLTKHTHLHIYKVNQLKIKAIFIIYIIYIIGCNSKTFYKNDANTVSLCLIYLGYDNGNL